MSVLMPLASFLAAFLVLIPLPGHWRARNVPTLSIIFWLFAINTAHGINTIAWAGNVDLKFLRWCDIAIRLDIGGNIALPAACLRLCMHLESVASIRHVTTSSSDKRSRTIMDLLVCVALPLLYIALFYIVQGHRFDIVEDFGCHAEDYVSIPEFFLVWFLPIIFSLGTFIFAGIAFFHFFKRRANFAKHLASSNASLTPGRYFRLMAMSLVEMFWTILVITCTLSYNYSGGLRPWTNWDDVHSNWSRVNRFPRLIIPPNALHWTYFLWWTTPISALFFVLFFAFGQDAMRDYSTCVKWVRGMIFRQTPKHAGMSSFRSSQGAILPLSVPKPPAPIMVSISQSKVEDETKAGSFTLGDSISSTDSVSTYYEAHSHPVILEDIVVSSSDTPRSFTLSRFSCSMTTFSEYVTPPPQASLAAESHFSHTQLYAQPGV